MTTIFLRVRVRSRVRIYSFSVNSCLEWESNSGLLFFLGLGLELGLEFTTSLSTFLGGNCSLGLDLTTV